MIGRNQARELVAVHAIAPRIRAGAGGVFDFAVGDDLRHDLGDLTNAIVFLGLANVERVVVNDLTLGYGERGTRAVQRLMGDAYDAGLIPNRVQVEFAG